MDEAITVRPAERADLPATARLAAKLVRYHHDLDPLRYLLEEPLEEGYAWWFGRELGNKSAVILVAARGDAIVGYAYGRMEERNWNDLLDACGKLHDVYVEEAFRKQGVAEALMRGVIERLEGMGAPRVVLLSAWSNEGAQRLFERLGFRRTMVEMTRERGG
jgi:ribosomal protein S18 acetylase RimI-like enzyme